MLNRRDRGVEGTYSTVLFGREAGGFGLSCSVDVDDERGVKQQPGRSREKRMETRRRCKAKPASHDEVIAENKR